MQEHQLTLVLAQNSLIASLIAFLVVTQLLLFMFLLYLVHGQRSLHPREYC
jgi:hypothetical protein